MYISTFCHILLSICWLAVLGAGGQNSASKVAFHHIWFHHTEFSTALTSFKNLCASLEVKNIQINECKDNIINLFAIDNNLFWEICGIGYITFLTLFWVVTSLYFHTLTDSVFKWHAYKIHLSRISPLWHYPCDLLLVILLNTHIRLDHCWAFDLINFVHMTSRPCCQPHFLFFS